MKSKKPTMIWFPTPVQVKSGETITLRWSETSDQEGNTEKRLLSVETPKTKQTIGYDS